VQRGAKGAPAQKHPAGMEGKQPCAQRGGKRRIPRRKIHPEGMECE